MFSVLAICLLHMPFAVADLVQFYEELEIKKLHESLGPNALLSEFLNQTDRKILPDNSCLEDLYLYKRGLENGETWAEKMMDSSSKVPAGSLIGNVIEMGMYDECMSVHAKRNGSEIIGNHCTYKLFFTYENKTPPLSPMLSICLPLSCDEKDLREVLQRKIHDTGGYQKFGVVGSDVLCSTGHSMKWTGGIIVFALFSVIFLVLLFFTILDWLKEKKIMRRDLPTAVGELSFYKNIQKIFSFQDSPHSIAAIHGLRALTTVCVVAGHCFFIRATGLFANNVEIFQLPPYVTFYSGFIIFGVDTFFTMSGFLVSYPFLRKYTRSEEKFNVGSFYFHRYIRLTPALGATLLTSIYLIPLMGSGPKWTQISKYFLEDVCEKKWWTVLLYINNLVYKDMLCMLHLWSTAVDMQLFWISPLILYPLARSPKQGLLILCSLIVVSIAIPAVVVASNGYPFLFELNLSVDLNNESFTNLYMPTYTRASPWLIGILLGYIVFKTSIELKQTTIFFWWLLTAASFLFCLIGLSALFEKDYEYNVVWETIFTTSSRPLWSISIAWIIFAAIRGYGGFVTKFLSLPIFFPISRLSFCLYLVHLGIVYLNTQTARIPIYYRPYHVFLGFIGDMTISTVLAIFFSIVFEIPVRTLENLIFNRASDHHKSKKNPVNDAKMDDMKINEEKV